MNSSAAPTEVIRGVEALNVTASWDNEEHTIIRYDFDLHWTWDEFNTAAAAAFAMTRSVEHTVDTISNFKPGQLLPPNALFQFRRAMANAPKNRGVNVIVSDSNFIGAMVATFSRFNKQLGERLLVVKTLDDARAALEKRRQV
jgi:hypothetical protein